MDQRGRDTTRWVNLPWLRLQKTAINDIPLALGVDTGHNELTWPLKKGRSAIALSEPRYLYVCCSQDRVGSQIPHYVRERALVRVLERPQLFCLAELLLDRVDLRLALVARPRSLQRPQAVLEVVALRDLREDAREIRTLLRGDLCGGRVRGRCAVADREDRAVRPDHAEMVCGPAMRISETRQF